MSTITQDQQAAIAAKLKDMTLPSGLGDEHSACSIAAINLALTGKLTDKIPDCMSLVIGRWIIGVQDAMPHEMRNSLRWKSLLPLAAGTGRDHEQERLALIMEWMWGTVLPTLQPIAELRGFGAAWLRMTTERTEAAAKLAAKLAEEAARVATTAVAATAWAAVWAAKAEAMVAKEAAVAATRVAEAAAVAAAAWAADAAGGSLGAAAAWEQFDLYGLLHRLIEVKS